LQICTPLIGDGLCRFVFDILDLWFPCHVSCLLAVLLGLGPWLLAALTMFCNLSSDDWKPSCHLDTHSGCGKVREGCPPPMGQNISASTARSSEMSSAEFFIILHHCIYEHNALPFLFIQDLTSSIDAGHLYVDRKFLVN
jgi:hypothetical protein